MTAGPWTLVNEVRALMLAAAYDFTAASTYKVALVTSSSNIGAASTAWAGVTNEVANANGYTTGGIAVTMTATGAPSAVLDFVSNPVWAASGGSIVARFAVLYKIGGHVIAYCLLDSTPADVSATNGNNMTIDSDGTPNPVITLG
jgi:hypothetical protein